MSYVVCMFSTQQSSIDHDVLLAMMVFTHHKGNANTFDVLDRIHIR